MISFDRSEFGGSDRSWFTNHKDGEIMSDDEINDYILEEWDKLNEESIQSR